ncbi:MAG: hypothetical protein QOF30_2237 [Acidimicrobiaceae bacterium]|nr:hypothetical protein [Acidimicrobiaceae bacterium]
MIERPSLPVTRPAAARAAISPSALVLAGAGTAVGLVVGLPALAAAAVGATFWGVRVGVGAALAAGRRRRASRPEMIDPYAVPEPWRSFVRESLTAQTKFDQAVARSHAGPLRDRLAEVSGRVHEGVRECWRVAHLGAALDAGLGALDADKTSREMRRLQETRPRGSDSTEAAMAAQLKAARRVEAASRRATDRLRVLTAELNAAVACAVDLSLDTDDIVAARRLAGDVDTVVGEIEALRLALEETSAGAHPSPG